MHVRFLKVGCCPWDIGVYAFDKEEVVFYDDLCGREVGQEVETLDVFVVLEMELVWGGEMGEDLAWGDGFEDDGVVLLGHFEDIDCVGVDESFELEVQHWAVDLAGAKEK